MMKPQHPILKRFGARWAPWLVLLAALTQIALSFHHHDDLDSHDSCDACQVGHQTSIAPNVVPAVCCMFPTRVEFRPGPSDVVGFPPGVLGERVRGPPSLG